MPSAAGVSPAAARTRATSERAPVTGAAAATSVLNGFANAASASAAAIAVTAAAGGQRAQRERPVGVGDPERDGAAGDGDRAEEDRVEDDEEGEERARRAARAQAGAPERPDRQGRAADAAGGQQPGRARAAERDLRARAEVEAVARAAADEPEQGDVADEGQDLEGRGGHDPARVGVEGAAEGVGEGPERAAGHHEGGDDDRGEGGRDGGAAGERAQVEGREDEVSRSVGGGGHGCSLSRGASQRCAAQLFAAGAGSDVCGRD